MEPDDPMYNDEVTDDERDMETPEPKSNLPGADCTAEPEDLMDMMESQTKIKEMY
jgi:hypothetical protein